MFKFIDQDIDRNPSPHIITPNFFDQDFFKQLKEQFPSEEYFQRGGGGGQKAKNRLNLEDPSPVYYEFLKSAPAWQRLHEHVSSKEFVYSLYQKFKSDLKDHGCKVVDAGELTAKVQICRSFSGYHTPVHTDGRHKLLISLIYLNDMEEYGNGGEFSYFKVKALDKFLFRKRSIKSLEKVLKDERIIVDDQPERFVDKVATVAPKENFGLSMINSPISFHQASKLHTGDTPRKFVYITLMAKEQKSQWDGFKPYY